ncbi:MAG TPA: hypothetical protein VD994_15715 [Prosthecobacter sp.]|nr:hypothetical protein [Prosthecobacter sp.]
MKSCYFFAEIGPMGTPEVVVVTGLLLFLVTWIWAMIDCVRAESGWPQGLWLIAIIFFGIPAAPLYLLCRKLPRTLRKVPIPKHPISLFCCRCGLTHTGPYKVGISGITKFSCTACGDRNKFPAAVAVQAVYWGVVGLILFTAGTGGFAGRDGLSFGAIILLVLGLTWTTESLSVAKKVERAKRFHQSRTSAAMPIKGPPQRPPRPPMRRAPPRIR